MITECYHSGCKHHSYHEPNEKGPFCYKEKCALELVDGAMEHPTLGRYITGQQFVAEMKLIDSYKGTK